MTTEVIDEGDLVRVTDGEDVIITRVVTHPDGYLCINPLGDKDPNDWRFISWYRESTERKLELVEKAKPKLPTEPGSVVRFNDSFVVFQLFKSGFWQNAVMGREHSYSPDDLLKYRGPDFKVLLEVKE